MLMGKREWISLEMRPRLVIYQPFLVVTDEDQSMHESLRNSCIMHELSRRSVDLHWGYAIDGLSWLQDVGALILDWSRHTGNGLMLSKVLWSFGKADVPCTLGWGNLQEGLLSLAAILYQCKPYIWTSTSLLIFLFIASFSACGTCCDILRMLFQKLCTSLVFAALVVDGALAAGRPSLGSRSRRAQDRARAIVREATRDRLTERATNGTAKPKPARRFNTTASQSLWSSFYLQRNLLIYAEYVVESLPEVNFDVGEMYSGLMPISESNTSRALFFLFEPTIGKPVDEVTIWLNGGPGCSSLEGFLQEMGRFLWQPGTYAPVENP